MSTNPFLSLAHLVSPSCRCKRRERCLRFIGLDVHLDFCEIAICDAGRVRSGGRVRTSAQGLQVLAKAWPRTIR